MELSKFDWKTSYHSPFAIIISGTGHKMVFITERSKKGLLGHTFIAHWKKVLKGDHRVYKTRRIVTNKSIVHEFRSWPKPSTVKRVIEKSLKSERFTHSQ